ncbi:hypothetical protein B577_24850, partial [Salmonella enterica subsp. enterica serovar Typhimurium str. STm9]
RGSFQGETPGIFIVLSGFATSDLSVDFCDARQGGGAYGKTPATRPFYGSWPFAGLLLIRHPRLYPNDRAQRVSERGSGERPIRKETAMTMLMQLARQVSRLESGQ